MDTHNDKESRFNLLFCRLTFTDEPMWFRLVVIGAGFGAVVTLFIFTREWAVCTAIVQNLPLSKMGAIFGKIKGV